MHCRKLLPILKSLQTVIIVTRLFSNFYMYVCIIVPLQDFYSEPLPTTARTLDQSFTHEQLRVKDLPRVPTRRLEVDSNPQPPAARHRTYPYTTTPHCIMHTSLASSSLIYGIVDLAFQWIQAIKSIIDVDFT